MFDIAMSVARLVKKADLDTTGPQSAPFLNMQELQAGSREGTQAMNANTPRETGAVAPAIHSLCSPKPFTRGLLPAVTRLPGAAEPCDLSPVGIELRRCQRPGREGFLSAEGRGSYPSPDRSGKEQAPTHRAGLGAGEVIPA